MHDEWLIDNRVKAKIFSSSSKGTAKKNKKIFGSDQKINEKGGLDKYLKMDFTEFFQRRKF